MAPIHSAAEYGKSTVVQTLLDSGARTDVVDNVSTVTKTKYH